MTPQVAVLTAEELEELLEDAARKGAAKALASQPAPEPKRSRIDPETAYSYDRAACLMGVSKRTVGRMVQRGDIRTCPGSARIPGHEIQRWMGLS